MFDAFDVAAFRYLLNPGGRGKVFPGFARAVAQIGAKQKKTARTLTLQPDVPAPRLLWADLDGGAAGSFQMDWPGKAVCVPPDTALLHFHRPAWAVWQTWR